MKPRIHKTNKRHKNKFCFSWKYFHRFLRVIEVASILVAAVVVFQIPRQLYEWENNQDNRAFDQLVKLDDIISNKTDEDIFRNIEENKPILKKNGGKYSTDDLDNHLNNIYDIYDAYSKGIISKSDVYNWFSDYLTKTMNDSEIKKHLENIRREDSMYYQGLEEFVWEINSN